MRLQHTNSSVCMDDAMENQDSPPPLDPSLAPALLFEPGHGDDEAAEETTDDDDDNDNGTRFLYSIPNRQLLAVRGLDYLNGDTIWITPQGWVLVLDPSTRDAFLRDPFTSRTVRLPSDLHQESLLPSSNEHTKCLLSTPRPDDAADDPGGCIVLLVDLEDPVLWYCVPGGRQWFRHEYPSELIARDNDHNTIMGTMGMLTAARGKFYSYHFGFGDGYDDKLVTLEFSPGPVFSSTHVARTPLLSRCFELRLVESWGDLFLLRISLEPLRLRAQGITEIYVYKLVLSPNNDWVTVKVAALGDNRVFFSGSCGDAYDFGASMAADEVGLKANCIYFTHGADKGLYVHDMERGTTTLHNPATDVPDSVKPLLLMHAIL